MTLTPTIIRYHINSLKSLVLIYFNKNLILIIPNMAEVMIAIMVLILTSAIKSLNFKIVAPKIIGVDNRKENLVTASLETPNNLPVTIVVPDLENPGKIARA